MHHKKADERSQISKLEDFIMPSFDLTCDIKKYDGKQIQQIGVLPIKLCRKFGKATVSRFPVIKDFLWAKVWAEGYLAIWAKIISINVWQIGL